MALLATWSSSFLSSLISFAFVVQASISSFAFSISHARCPFDKECFQLLHICLPIFEQLLCFFFCCLESLPHAEAFDKLSSMLLLTVWQRSLQFLTLDRHSSQVSSGGGSSVSPSSIASCPPLPLPPFPFPFVKALLFPFDKEPWPFPSRCLSNSSSWLWAPFFSSPWTISKYSSSASHSWPWLPYGLFW